MIAKFPRRTIAFLLAVAVTTTLFAGSGDDKVVAFSEVGIIVDIQTFYDVAEVRSAAYEPIQGGQGRHALITPSGVYAFLETPSNEAHLREIKPGSSVRVSGKLLTNGTLLHIDDLATVSEATVDLSTYKSAKGEMVEISGYNLCQCGLNVGELPHSCQLGHRHHLQGDDGKIYHYLQYGDAQKAYLGQGSHFRAVTVNATVLPGQYLLVDAVTVK